MMKPAGVIACIRRDGAWKSKMSSERYAATGVASRTMLMSRPLPAAFRSANLHLGVVHGGKVEVYLDDKPYPRCLIDGDTSGRDPVHSVWAYNQGTAFAVQIAAYRPDPNCWVEWWTRRVK